MEQKKQLWKPFIRLMRLAHIPFLGYLVYILLQIAITKLTVKLPGMESRLLAGDIYNEQVIRSWVYLTLINTGGGLIAALYSGWLQLRMNRNLQRTVLSKLIRIPMKDYKQMDPSSMISRVTDDTNQISTAWISVVVTIVMLYTVYAYIEIMLSYSRKITLALLAVIPLMLVISRITGRMYYRANNQRQQAYSDLTGNVSERLLNIRSIKIFGTQAQEDTRNHTYVEGVYRGDVRKAMAELAFYPMNYSIPAVSKAVVLIYGAYLLANKEIHMFTLITMISYAELIPSVLQQMVTTYTEMKAAQGMASKASALVNIPSEEHTCCVGMDEVEDGDICMETVSFSYDHRPVLQNVELQIPKGKITALVGPSGTGKTTLLNLLERIYTPDGGIIRYGDTDLTQIHLDSWRTGVCCIQQNSLLTGGTIRENIEFGLGRSAREEELIQAARIAQAHEFIMELPDGYDTKVGDLGEKLSGGQRQRIAIARAVIMNPKILIMDEATGNLDPVTAAQVRSSLLSAAEGRTTLVITHNMAMAQMADQIAVMDEGRIIAAGSHQQLYGSCPLYTQFCDLQQK